MVLVYLAIIRIVFFLDFQFQFFFAVVVLRVQAQARALARQNARQEATKCVQEMDRTLMKSTSQLKSLEKE